MTLDISCIVFSSFLSATERGPGTAVRILEDWFEIFSGVSTSHLIWGSSWWMASCSATFTTCFLGSSVETCRRAARCTGLLDLQDKLTDSQDSDKNLFQLIYFL